MPSSASTPTPPSHARRVPDRVVHRRRSDKEAVTYTQRRAGRLPSSSMTGIQPELWIDRAEAAVTFYQAAFGARVLHRVGEGDDIVAQLAVGDAAFWVAPGGAEGPRFSPQAIGGATGRVLLVVDDPDAVFAQAVGGVRDEEAAGSNPATPTSSKAMTHQPESWPFVIE